VKKFLVILMIATNINANEVTFLPKGSVTKTDGYLFPENIARETRLQLIEADIIKTRYNFLEKQVEIKDNMFNLQKKEIDNLLERNGTLNSRLDKRESMSRYESMLWFTLGAFITGMAAKGLSK
jgi:hypothetical protein